MFKHSVCADVKRTAAFYVTVNKTKTHNTVQEGAHISVSPQNIYYYVVLTIKTMPIIKTEI